MSGRSSQKELHKRKRKGASASEAKLERFCAARARTVEIVEHLSQRQLDYSPGRGKWSMGQVLDHLLLTEQFWQQEIRRMIELSKKGQRRLRRTFSDIDVSVLFIPRSILPFFDIPFTVMNLFLPTALRNELTRYRVLPFQTPSFSQPRKGLPGSELRKRLRSQIAETEKLFVANRSCDFDAMIHQHPLLGTNTMPQALRILTLHEQRHQSQIAEILAKARSSKLS